MRRATWAFGKLNWWRTWDTACPCGVPEETFLPHHHEGKHMSKKFEVIYLWWHKPVIDQKLLQGLPNLKVIVNSEVGMDHMDLKLVASFGVKMANTS